MKILKFVIKPFIVKMFLVSIFCSNICYGQVTALDNNPATGAFLGWNGAQHLELRTNNLTHLQIMQTGNSTINGYTISRGGFVGISQDPVMFTSGLGTPFSLLHLNGDKGGGPLTNGYRDWMRYGLTMTHNRDLMYIGQRAMSAYDRTDAVIAWADNTGEFNGPDNLCFVFTTSDGTSTTPTDPNSSLGRETARMTAFGHTGIGIQWSNDIQPKRTLDVVRHDTVPQFRITRENHEDETGGIYTDFETSDLGHLHILPRDEATKNVGIGFLSGTSVPTERLDVYAGTARLREVPNNTPHVLITGRMQDVDPTTGDYVLNRLAFNGNPNSFLAGNGTWQNGTNVCDWNISGQNLITGYGGACHTGNVCIGRSIPQRKLDVLDGVEPTIIGANNEVAAGRFVNTREYNRSVGVMGAAAQETPNTNISASTGGFFVGANSAHPVNGSNYGVVAIANDLLPQGENWIPAPRESIGVRSYASRATDVFGVFGTANNGNLRNIGVSGYSSRPITNSWSIGVYGRSDCQQGFVPQMNIGVYGEAQNGCGIIDNYAGYFAGNVVIGGNAINFSDASLKTNVQEIDGALNTINQLMPKTYDYLTEENQSLGLAEGQQFGLIAQDVAEVLPNLTKLVRTLPQIDSIGNVLTESNQFLAINYTGLIPVLIAGMKEQQTIIDNQNEVLAQMMEQLASMQQQINQCCNADDGTKSLPGGTFQPQDLNNEKSSEGGNELYQNIPNPFRESTTISYQLEFGGRVQLSIYDGNGKVVTTLVDANQPNGRHSAVWNANGMPSGVYHYALYVDGELLVKRAIKLQE